MATDEDLISAKKAELTRIVSEALGDCVTPDQQADLDIVLARLLHANLSVQPPEQPKFYVHLITASSFSPNRLNPDISGADSLKPGNVTIDMQRLLVAGAQTVRDVVATVKVPWLLPMSALILWDRLWSLLRIKITENEACVIWVMWMNCDEDQTVPEAILMAKVNEDRAAHGHAPLSDKELFDALTTLEKMHCIKRSRNDPTKWWLREWVRVKYR